MRIPPFAFLLAAALVLAGCASNDAGESRDTGPGDGGGAREVSGQVEVVGGSGNQTTPGSGNTTASG